MMRWRIAATASWRIAATASWQCWPPGRLTDWAT
jgi:hypothetical protein